MSLITVIITEAQVARMPGKCIAYIHFSAYSFCLNLAAEIVYQYFSLTQDHWKGDLSRWVLQAVYCKRVIYRYVSCCTPEQTLLQNYVKKAKLQLHDGFCDLGSNLIFHPTLSRLFHKQNKGMSYTASCYAKTHLNSMHSFSGTLGLTSCLQNRNQKSPSGLKENRNKF